MDPADDNFDALRKLLALKRHEQPPPGYFDRLPDRILDRLDRSERDEPADWLQSLLDHLHFRPALLGVFGFSLGAFYLLGLGPSGGGTPPPFEPSWLVDGSPAAAPRQPIVWEPVPASVMARRAASSVAPVIHTGTSGSLLPAIRAENLERIERASYTPFPR